MCIAQDTTLNKDLGHELARTPESEEKYKIKWNSETIRYLGVNITRVNTLQVRAVIDRKKGSRMKKSILHRTLMCGNYVQKQESIRLLKD